MDLENTDYPIVVHARLTREQNDRLNEISRMTHMKRSQVIRYLLETATIKPAIIRTEELEPTQ